MSKKLYSLSGMLDIVATEALKLLIYATIATVLAALILVVFYRPINRFAMRMHRRFGKEAERIKIDQEQVRKLAYFDLLTGLPNRFLLNDRLHQTLTHAKRQNRTFAILFIDLDDFKRINDTLGHHVGDHLLKEVSSRVADCLRVTDTVARVGGDEFVIILPDVENAEACRVVLDKIMEALSTPINMEQAEIYITASIGISLYPQDAKDIETLIRKADRAMYDVKAKGKNDFSHFVDEMELRSRDRLETESLLRKALEFKQMELVYQPLYSLRDRSIIGVEAFVRWRHPELGLMDPQHFLPIAEANGFIVQIDEWVLNQACMEMQQLSEMGYSLDLSINLSTRHFHRDALIPLLSDIQARSGFALDKLILEFNESGLLENEQQRNEMIGKLRSMGIRMTIDNYGTGYSSLTHMKRFPFDMIKIDRSFIKDVPFGPKDSAITSALITLGRKLGLQVVAVGVENESQLAFLTELDCAAVQGYLIGKPIKFKELPALLSNNEFESLLYENKSVQ